MDSAFEDGRMKRLPRRRSLVLPAGPVRVVRRSPGVGLAVVAASLWLAGCATRPTLAPGISPQQVRNELMARLPSNLADRSGWAADIETAFTSLGVTPTVSHLCAALAVTAQESGFKAAPEVPNLARIARDEIDRRAANHHIPRFVVSAALKLRSPDGRSYEQRLSGVRSEGELSRIYEDLIGSVPLGKRLFSDENPVRTGGPMQVGIAFAEAWNDQHRYPYTPAASVRREVFTRRGGMYYGIAHLLAYPVAYDRMLYRFADYNAGFYASRNAAFQNAVAIASGHKLALDGDLVSYADASSQTELAVRALAPELDASPRRIHSALARGDRFEFEQDELYRRVFELAERKAGKALPRAMLPRIRLHSPKISRRLTTAWFAERVDRRYRDCLHGR